MELLIQYIDHIAKKDNQIFVIDDANRTIVKKLYDYFMDFEGGELNNRKGILLIGNIGSGKTTLLKLFRDFMCEKNGWSSQSDKNFIIESTLDVLRKYENAGYDDMSKYFGTTDRYSTKARSICFDDLGIERTNVVKFGNTVDVVTEILYARYDLYQNDNILTHATSNLDIESIKLRYGQRLTSRFREMFNIVVLTGEDRRK